MVLEFLLVGTTNANTVDNTDTTLIAFIGNIYNSLTYICILNAANIKKYIPFSHTAKQTKLIYNRYTNFIALCKLNIH